MKREGREVWRERVTRWVASGLNAQEFAAHAGIRASTLENWKYRLRAEQRHRTDGPHAEEPRFIEVAVPSVATAGLTSISRRGAAATSAVARDALVGGEVVVEVILRDGLRVRAPVWCDSTALRRLVTALEGR
jgi:hypothetical protein